MSYDPAAYCPRCKSRLYPGDKECMVAVGVCSDCVCYDRTPGRQLQAKLATYRAEMAKDTVATPYGIYRKIPNA